MESYICGNCSSCMACLAIMLVILARHAMLHGSKYVHLACMLHVPNPSLHATTLRYLRQLLYLKLSFVGVDVLWATLDPHGNWACGRGRGNHYVRRWTPCVLVSVRNQPLHRGPSNRFRNFFWLLWRWKRVAVLSDFFDVERGVFRKQDKRGVFRKQDKRTRQEKKATAP